MTGQATERIFQSQIEQIAAMNGWLIHHPSPHQVRPGVWRSDGKGFPDLCLAHHSRGLIFAELKSSDGRLSFDQKQWAQCLRNAGVEYYVWRPDQLDLIATRLGRMA